MAVKVAYGKRNDIQNSINNGTIPENTIIITKDKDAELLFYDSKKNLKTIVEQNKFETMSEAERYIQNYECNGTIVSIHNGSDWCPYIVNNNKLMPITENGSGESYDYEIVRIDGNRFD